MRTRLADGREWFFEETQKLDEPGTLALGLLPSRELYRGRTPYQSIEIFDNDDFGRVLVLDGLIQLSSRHEAVYHEMLVHPAMLSHPRPRRIAVVGGGDGGVLREILKHPVDSVLLVDIDAEVTRLCRQYLPELSAGAFDDPRVQVVNEDALKRIPKHPSEFDLIVVDCTDCYGPSELLWQESFYRQVSNALRPGGIAAFQTGFLMEAFAKRGRRAIRRVFPEVQVHRAFVRCYPSDESSFTVASKAVRLSRVRMATLRRRFHDRALQTSYYTPAMHAASAIIPEGYDDDE